MVAVVDDPEVWRWVWLGAAVIFGLGEMASPGSFFLAPFAIGALIAAIFAFIGAGVIVGWVLFIVISLVAFAALRPLARRLDALGTSVSGVGASRLVGQQAVVLQSVPPGPDGMGLVRVGREEWRAASIDGSAIPENATVSIAEVQGTRVIVYPVGPGPQLPPPSQPPRRST